MKKLIVTVASALTLSVLAADKVAKKELSPEEKAAKRAEMQKRMYERTGGFLEKPGSMQGKIAIIDTQSEVASSNFTGIVKMIVEMTKYNVVYEKAAAGEPDALRKASKADLAVVIVADDKTPAMLVAPEDKWATINVRNMGKFKSDELKAKFHDSRCGKELLRAYSMLCGGAGSMYVGNVISSATIEQTDQMHTFIPFDVMDKHRKYFEQIGITPKLIATYRQACRQGWAPAPTNDVQAAIAEAVKNEPKKDEAKKK